jgi:hypothetical protein
VTAFLPLIFFGSIALLNFWRLERLEAFQDGTLWRAALTGLNPEAAYGGGLFFAMTVLHQSVLMLLVGIIVIFCWLIGLWIKRHEVRMLRRILNHLRAVDPNLANEPNPESSPHR